MIKGLWSCCNKRRESVGCQQSATHKMRDYRPGELEKLWTFYETPAHTGPGRPRTAVVVDCEMGTADSGESELIRLSAVDFFTGEILVDSLVFPDVKMAHFNTRYSGVRFRDMYQAHREGTCILGRDQAREAVWRHVGPETLLVGHALHMDLLAMRWRHFNVVDTLLVEQRWRRDARDTTTGFLSLKALTLERLHRGIQAGPHHSLEDAIATRDLLHSYLNEPDKRDVAEAERD